MKLRERLVELLGGDEPADPDAPVMLGPVNFSQSGVISAALSEAGIRHRVIPTAGFYSRLDDQVAMVVAPANAARASAIIDEVGFRPGRAGRR